MDENSPRSSVEFTNEQPSPEFNQESPKIIGLVMKLGLAKDEKSASKVLLIVTAILVVLAVLIFIFVRPAIAPSDENAIPSNASDDVTQSI